jgi:hypothetical protein
MNITIAAAFRWRDTSGVLVRAIETCLAVLGRPWLDAMRSRCGPPQPEWLAEQHDADEEPRLMVALSCAVLH